MPIDFTLALAEYRELSIELRDDVQRSRGACTIATLATGMWLKDSALSFAGMSGSCTPLNSVRDLRRRDSAMSVNREGTLTLGGLIDQFDVAECSCREEMIRGPRAMVSGP